MESLAFLQAMRRRYGDVFTVRLKGEQPLVVVGEPELAKQVFGAPPDVLRAGEGNRRTLGWLLGDHSLSLLDGPRHIDHRRLLLSAFHGERMERHAAAMREVAQVHLAAWPQGPGPVLPRMRMLTLDVVMCALFGGRGRGLDSLRTVLLELQSPSAQAGDGAAAERLVAEAGTLVGAAVVRRRENPRRSEHDDVLSLLLEAALEDGSPLSDTEIRDELVTLLMAGYETTASALAWALERLARHPTALAAVEEEAEAGGGSFTDAVIYETLRMRPPVPMSARLVRRTMRLGERSVPPGAVLAVSALLVHHRPDVYDEPMSFRPERFVGRKPGTYTWIPFGGGTRRCIGAGFAMQEMRTVLPALLARMRLHPSESEPEPARNRGSTLVPARGASVVLEHRRAAARRSTDLSFGAGGWAGDGLRREVFFFRSNGVELYGSLFAAMEISRPYGLVACQSWGTDADRTDPLLRSVALTMARLGGAAMVFHYPGFGDSFGDLAGVGLTDLRDAGRDAAAEASRRCPGLTWIFAGFMFGASVACLAQAAQPCGEPLLLVQPELRPGAYCRWLARTSMQIAPGPSPKQMMEVGTEPGMAYGYPIPQPILEHPAAADETVAAALASHRGGGAVIRHRKPGRPAPEGFECIELDGAWRFGSQNHPELAAAAAGWLDRVTGDVAPAVGEAGADLSRRGTP